MNKQHHKNLPGVSPKQKHHHWEFLLSWRLIKKNDYKSVISITFISDIVFHLAAILTLNKSNGKVLEIY